MHLHVRNGSTGEEATVELPADDATLGGLMRRVGKALGAGEDCRLVTGGGEATLVDDDDVAALVDGQELTVLPPPTWERQELFRVAGEAARGVAVANGHLLTMDFECNLKLRSLKDGEVVGALEGQRAHGEALAGHYRLLAGWCRPDGSSAVAFVATAAGGRSRLRQIRIDGTALPALTGHQGHISCAAVTSDGATLYTGGHDGKILAHDLADGTVRRLFSTCCESWVTCMELAADDSELFYGDRSGQVVRTKDLAGGSTLTVRFQSDRELFALSAGCDGTIYTSGLRTDGVQCFQKGVHDKTFYWPSVIGKNSRFCATGPQASVAVSPCQQTLLTGPFTGNVVTQWDIARQCSVQEIDCGFRAFWVRAVPLACGGFAAVVSSGVGEVAAYHLFQA